MDSARKQEGAIAGDREGAEPKSEWRRRKGLVLRVSWVRGGGLTWEVATEEEGGRIEL